MEKPTVEVPTVYVPDSAAADIVHLSDHELHQMFGNRQFPDLGDFGELLSHCKVRNLTESLEELKSIGDFVTQKRRRRRKGKVSAPCQAGHTFGFDIGFGPGCVSPGGHRYCLLFIDKTTKEKWIYGLRDLTSDTLLDAFWQLYNDAGGFPERFECDSDPKFVGGKVRTLLKRRGIKL